MARTSRRPRSAAADQADQTVEQNETTDQTTDQSAPAEPEGNTEENVVTTETLDTQADVENAPVEGTPDGDATPQADATPAEPSGEGAAEGGDAKAEEVDPKDKVLTLAHQLVDERDQATGALSTQAVAQFGAAYRELDPNGKKAVRAGLTASISENMSSETEDTDLIYANLLKAKTYNELLNETKKSATATKAAAPKVDPTESYVEQYMATQIAAMSLVRSKEVDVEKAGESIQNLVTAYSNPESAEYQAFQAYVTWLRAEDKEKRGDEPEVPEFVKKGLKIAEGKAVGRATRKASSGTKSSSGGGGGKNRNVGTHVTEALAEREVGEFVSIADICKFKSSEYGEDSPSAGAVSARLFPPSGGPSTIENVEGVTAEESGAGKKGARRTA